jgi:hypothetical protein
MQMQKAEDAEEDRRGGRCFETKSFLKKQGLRG